MIPAAFTAINTAIAANSTLNKITGVAQTVHKGGQSVAKGLHGLAAQGSYSDIAQLSRAEFLTLVDVDCLNVDFLPEVSQSILSISTAYYLQAMSMIGSDNSVQVMNTLGRLKPGGLTKTVFSMESHSAALNPKNTEDGRWKMALESYKWKLPNNSHDVAAETQYVLESFGKEAVASVKENANLSVGKLIDVKLGSGDQATTIPVSFRLNVKIVPSKDVINILSTGKREHTPTERYHAWKSGEIEFIKDFILCSDMVKERKKLMMNDKSGAMTAIMNRANNPKRLLGLIGRNPDLGAATANIVMSSTTAKELERVLVGSLEDFKTRQRIFEAGHALLMVVIDKQFEEITFYHRGIAESSTMRVRDIKMSNKDGGPSLTDMMSALLQGRPPSF